MRGAVGAIVLVVVVASACAPGATGSPAGAASQSPAATSSPPETSSTASASPSATPASSTTSSPVAGGWPVTGASDPVFGADGTAYACIDAPAGNRLVAALDASGRMRAGWPFPAACDWILVSATDGSILVGADGAAGFELHRLTASGQELPGWPYRGSSAGRCWWAAVAASGTAVLGCIGPDEATATIAAIDPAGQVVAGWPVTLPDVRYLGGSWGDGIQLGLDGTVYSLALPAGNGANAQILALATDGSRRPGFPVTLAAPTAGFLVVPGDRLLVGSYVPPDGEYGGGCGTADRTVITELDRSGRPVPGWPETASGWASRPAVAADGTVYYLTKDRLFARAPDGSLRAGWPVAIPTTAPECADVGPWLTADGTVYVKADGYRAFGPDGRARAGWPYRLPNGEAGYGCVHPDRGFSPAIGPDGRLYVVERPAGDQSVAATEIAALDESGQVVAGWPFRVPVPETGQIDRIDVNDGRLYVSLVACDATGHSSALLAVDHDGSLAR